MRWSLTGKLLCHRCRRLATHECGYHRSHGQPAYLVACAEHASLHADALPIVLLETLLTALGADVTPTMLRAALALAGIDCAPAPAQNALWVRHPEKFCWSAIGYYVSREEALMERPRAGQVGAAFQRRMDSLLIEKE
jgi:hypothetical protein